MTRVLLTGANGQLGRDVVLAGENIDLVAFSRAELDVTNGAQTLAKVKDVRPDVIIHAAAYTAVDDCESSKQLAYDVNAAGTANVVAAAARNASRLIYISTDYVFDGTKPTPYVELDQPNPASVYGASKLAGENAVRELGGKGLIVRTSWVCGLYGSNMVKTILRAAENHPVLTFVDDQIGKPTFTTDLAAVLLTLAQREDSGVMHVTNEGVVSWYEFCRDVLSSAGLDPDRVRPCSTEELQPPRPAPRPANSVLENTRFPEIGLPLLRDYREPLAEVVRDLTS
jgi:dTDP-4-dehydrorhamnose reductase